MMDEHGQAYCTVDYSFGDPTPRHYPLTLLHRDLTQHTSTVSHHRFTVYILNNSGRHDDGNKEKQDTCHGGEQPQISKRGHRRRWRQRRLEVNKDRSGKVSRRKGKERGDGAGRVARGDGEKVIKDVEAGDGGTEQRQGHI